MIRVPAAGRTGSPERFALEVLVDLSRLVPVEDPDADVVQLEVVEGPAPADGWTGGRDGDALGLRTHDGCVRIPVGTLRRITDVAGRAAELRCPQRDRFGRVPSVANPLVIAGLERRAVISRAGMALRQKVIEAANHRRVLLVAPWPRSARWAAAITHDLDAVAAWPIFTLLRLAELGRKRQGGAVARTAAAALANIGRAPLRRAAFALVEQEHLHGIRATWFVLCGTPTVASMRAGDLTYRPESPAARAILQAIVAAGHEVGLHGSFVTAVEGTRFVEQRQRLAELIGRRVQGVRQHFLRARIPETLRDMAAAGFAYDSTCGFPDRNGFRLGAADILPAWDAECEAALALELVPFAWMDRALSKYRRIERPEAWVDDALDLAAECRAVEGLWTGIWHPNLVAPLGFPGAPEAFARLTREILASSPYVAPIAELVRWRAARRSVRVRRIADDGRMHVTAAAGSPAPLVIEDVTGRAVHRVDEVD